MKTDIYLKRFQMHFFFTFSLYFKVINLTLTS